LFLEQRFLTFLSGVPPAIFLNYRDVTTVKPSLVIKQDLHLRGLASQGWDIFHRFRNCALEAAALQ